MERTFTIQQTDQNIGIDNISVIESTSRPLMGLIIAILLVFLAYKYL